MTISMYVSTEVLRSLHTQDAEHALARETLCRRKPDDGCIRRQARCLRPRRYPNRRPLHPIGPCPMQRRGVVDQRQTAHTT
jgi:hypothetical protein